MTNTLEEHKIITALWNSIVVDSVDPNDVSSFRTAQRMLPYFKKVISQELQRVREEERRGLSEELKRLKHLERFLFYYVRQEGEIRLKESSTLTLEPPTMQRFDNPKTGEIVLKYSPQQREAK